MRKILSRLILFSLIVFSTGGLAGFSQGQEPWRASRLEVDQNPLYFPLVMNQYPPVEIPPLVDVTVTGGGVVIGYPELLWVSGFVTSQVPRPVYSVAIGIELTNYPYCEPDGQDDPCEPYPSTETAYPAFPVTLPGQNNPFFWGQLYGKSGASIERVKILSASLENDTNMTYSTVTVLEWHREGLAVVGRLRNDRGEDLENIRVVVAVKECRWEEATPDRSGLRPGQRTGFRLETFYCTGDDVSVYAQGNK